MKLIPVGKSEFCKVDDDDYEVLSKSSWYLSTGYVRTTDFEKINGEYKTQAGYMHRKIMGLEKGNKLWVDHINGDKLDNRRENLRICHPHENAMNMAASKSSKTKIRGVFFDKVKNKWVAQIKVKGEKLWKKRFDNIEDAVLARSTKESELYGEYRSRRT